MSLIKYSADQIENVQFYQFPGTTVTVCCITTESGFSVTGYSDCLFSEDFDEQVGRDAAYKKAFDSLVENVAITTKATHTQNAVRNYGQ